MKKVWVAGLMALATTAASAAEGLYAGATYSTISVTDSSVPGVKVDLDALGVLGGYRFNDHVAVEGRLSTGVKDERLGNAKFSLDSYVGVNALGTLPLNASGFSLYGTLGYGRVEVSVSAPGVSASGSETSVSYGAGLMFTSGRFAVRGGYESLFDKQGVEGDGVTLTATYAF